MKLCNDAVIRRCQEVIEYNYLLSILKDKWTVKDIAHIAELFISVDIYIVSRLRNFVWLFCTDLFLTEQESTFIIFVFSIFILGIINKNNLSWQKYFFTKQK